MGVRQSGKRKERGLVLGVSAANSQGSGRHAEVRLHLEDEAAAEPRGSASTSRGSLLTLHCEEAAEEAAAEEEEAAPSPAPAQSPATAEWPARVPAGPASSAPQSRTLGAPRSARAAPPTSRRHPQQQRRAGCRPLCEHRSPARSKWGPRPRDSGRRSTRGLREASGRSPVCTGWPARLPG